MTRKKCTGTPLKVFSGKEAKLNRIILPLVEKKALAKEDVFHILRITKGFRHKTSKIVCRRMDALNKDGFIGQKEQDLAPSKETAYFKSPPRDKRLLKWIGKAEIHS